MQAVNITYNAGRLLLNKNGLLTYENSVEEYAKDVKVTSKIENIRLRVLLFDTHVAVRKIATGPARSDNL